MQENNFKLFCFLMIISSLFGCERDIPCGNTKVEILTGCNFRYWDAYNEHSDSPYGAYRFDTDGTCYYFMYYKRFYGDTMPPFRDFYSHEDVMSPNIYSLNGDSLALRSKFFDEKVLYFSRDSIALNKKGVILNTERKTDSFERKTILKLSKNQEDNFDIKK